MLKMAMMMRAPRPFLTLEQELAVKEYHLEETELLGRNRNLPLTSSQAQKRRRRGRGRTCGMLILGECHIDSKKKPNELQ